VAFGGSDVDYCAHIVIDAPCFVRGVLTELEVAQKSLAVSGGFCYFLLTHRDRRSSRDTLSKETVT
jgi:hypothetical protein